VTPHDEYLRPVTFRLHCDASDSAVAGILVERPEGTFPRAKFWRKLTASESKWSSCLREMTGYMHSLASLVRAQPDELRGGAVEMVGDHKAAVYIFAKGGSRRVDEETGALLITDCVSDILALAKEHGFEVRF